MSAPANNILYADFVDRVLQGKARVVNVGNGRQAIMTTYKGPTAHNGARIVARCQAKRIVVDCRAELDVEENSVRAAMDLADRMGWNGQWYMAGTIDGYVFVVDPRTQRYEDVSSD